MNNSLDGSTTCADACSGITGMHTSTLHWQWAGHRLLTILRHKTRQGLLSLGKIDLNWTYLTGWEAVFQYKVICEVGDLWYNGTIMKERCKKCLITTNVSWNGSVMLMSARLTEQMAWLTIFPYNNMEMMFQGLIWKEFWHNHPRIIQFNSNLWKIGT